MSILHCILHLKL